MKRLASWLRQIANEIDPPARRGRPSRAAERNAAAVDALFAAEHAAEVDALFAAEHAAEVDAVFAEFERAHGWPEEP